MTVENKVTIITGASGGLGQTVSQLFFEAGAKVVLVGSRLESVQPLADKFQSERALPVAANLSSAEGAESVVQAALNTFGRVDVLLNLAGGFTGGKPVHESDGDDLQKMLEINLWTAYQMSRAAVKPMIEQNWGRIVNTGSHDALKGRANFGAYAMSKAAVLRLTESMAEEVKSHHVLINAILPTTIDTEANRKAIPKANYSKWLKPQTIGKTLLFLCSEDLAISGAAIPLQGI